MESFSKDPIGFAAGDANQYRYVGNGPTNATDPSGLEEEYGPHWFNNGWTDWWNPVAYVGAWGHFMGDRIGTDWSTWFLKDHMASVEAARRRHEYTLTAYATMGDVRDDVSPSAYGRERQHILGSGLCEAGEDASRMIDAPVASAELALDVVGVVEGGVFVRNAATGIIEFIAHRAVRKATTTNTRLLLGVFDGHGAGQGFTSVFDEATGKLLLKPSSTADNLPVGFVRRRGGHDAVSRALGGNRANHHGFAVILQEDKTLRVTWRSGVLNRTPDSLVPVDLRKPIVDALEAATGRTVCTY